MVTHLFKKSVLGTVMAASALASASPAMADDYGRYRRHDDTGKVAAAAVAGVIVGALLSSNRNRGNRNCVVDHNGNQRCYRGNNGGYYNNGYNQNGYNRGGHYQQQGGYYGGNGGYYGGNGGYYGGNSGYYGGNGGYYQNNGHGAQNGYYNNQGGQHHEQDDDD